jgi:hypothetical protein
MTTWENFVARRKIDVSLFLSHNAITNREEFIAHLSSRGIKPPSEDAMNSIFPPQPSIVEEVEASTSSPEPEAAFAARRQSNQQNKKR